MTEEPEVPELAAETPAPRRKRQGRGSRWLLWIGAVLLVILVVIGGIVAYLFRRAEPMLRAALIENLEKRFHARVELDDMHLSIVDGFQVECRGLRIWLPKELTGLAASAPRKPSPADGNRSIKRPTTPAASLVDSESPVTPELNAALNSWRTEPWIVVGNMHFHASWRIRPGEPIQISVIHVEGVQVLLPPKEDRPNISLSGNVSGDGSQPAATSGGTTSSSAGTQSPASSSSPGVSGLFQMPKIVIQRIECNDALLVIERVQEPGKKLKMPLDFRIRRATLIPDGHGGPVSYEVDLVNAKPIGIVHTTGHFGPWVPGDPGALPLNGDYKFDHADLSTIPGIAGILSSTGQYSGSLRRLEVDGQTKTPDFRLERVSLDTGVSLTTQFNAVVDGTNGDTRLEQVDGMLGHTHILAKGQILRADNPDGKGHGHDILLDVRVDRGRIEDILEIAANREQPFMTGNLTLGNTHFHLPPGPEKVWDKLFLEGDFHLSQARFSNSTMQGRIEELSLRGQGKPKEVKSTNPTSIESDMQGHFKLDKGTLQSPDLVYRVPGAEIVVHGNYGLEAGSLAFEGDARLDASLSKIVGGWKGLLLKPADGWLRKNGAGTDVPIHINGTRKQPKFGVDFDRLGKTENSVQPAESRE
jgi:hypothetical protein